jgi:hypothetical protein
MSSSPLPKRFVFCENGRVEVRANTVSELKVALKELKLLKKEIRLEKKNAQAKGRASIPLLRKLVAAGVSVEGYPADPSVPPALRTRQFDCDVAEIRAGLSAFDGKIRVIEEVELKVEAAIIGAMN